MTLLSSLCSRALRMYRSEVGPSDAIQSFTSFRQSVWQPKAVRQAKLGCKVYVCLLISHLNSWGLVINLLPSVHE